MDLTYSPEHVAFRAEVRAWLAANVEDLPPPDTREAFEAHRAWERKLAGAGYAGLAWPRAFGGRDADPITQAIFEEEYFLAGGPERVGVVGDKLMGPTLMRHGTPDQQARWLPRILRGDDIWSQGFSEPGAGSDLASLRTRAVPDKEELVVDGQKVWTSYGAFADWIFVLARTGRPEERHRGLTFLAIDMRSEGVDARPITQIDGHAGFAEVFFTGVRVPRSNVVGEIGDGWTVALTTLGAEREAPARPAARYRSALRRLAAAADLDDPLVRDRLVDLYVETMCYEHASRRALSRLARGEEIAAGASVTKLQWSELERRLYETALELVPDFVTDERWHHEYWYARAATIYAGTTEIQRNIVAERILGLPR